MDSYSNRASSLFTTFTSVLFTVAALNHLTSYFNSPHPTGSIALAKGSTVEYSEFKQYRADQVRFEFDLTADLTSEYNWNVNQLYVYVVATYSTSKAEKNEVVVYDKIIKNFDEFKLNLKNVKSKYVLRDEFKGTLAGKKVTLVLRYQVMPIFGLLRLKEVPMHGSFTVPAEYNRGVDEKKPKQGKASA